MPICAIMPAHIISSPRVKRDRVTCNIMELEFKKKRQTCEKCYKRSMVFEDNTGIPEL